MPQRHRRQTLKRVMWPLVALAFPLSPGRAQLQSTTHHRKTMHFDPVPPIPAHPTPGKPGDFDFLSGHWRIHNHTLVQKEWIEYEGEASVYGILGGTCSVEELRIPARNFSGMGLRLLDAEKRVWSDHWVNAKSGVLSTPGQTGSFEDGAGIFWFDEDDGQGKRTRFAGIWDQIGPNNCRWRQVWSEDGGRTWQHQWIMHWTRA